MSFYTPQEALDAFIKDAGDEPVEFEGQNCEDVNEDNCSGWYVGDNRCCCGNRRVELLTSGDGHNGFYAFASAY